MGPVANRGAWCQPSASPTSPKMSSPLFALKNPRTRLPVHALDLVIPQWEGVLLGNRVDRLAGFLDSSQRDVDPDILEDIRKLAEQPVDALEPLSEKLVHSVLDGAGVAQVVDVHRIPDLTDALDPSLALLEP